MSQCVGGGTDPFLALHREMNHLFEDFSRAAEAQEKVRRIAINPQ
jgi:hypothetical protein